MNIKAFKLVTGEDILGEVVNISETFTIKNPVGTYWIVPPDSDEHEANSYLTCKWYYDTLVSAAENFIPMEYAINRFTRREYIKVPHGDVISIVLEAGNEL